MELQKGLVDYGYLVYLDMYDELSHFNSDLPELMSARLLNGWRYADETQRQDLQGHTVIWFRFERDLNAEYSIT